MTTTPPPYSLRVATESDLPFLDRLREQTTREYVERSYGWDDATQQKLLRENYEHARVVLVDDKPAGIFKVIPLESEIHLCQIQLVPECQGKGLGTLLVEEVKRRAQAAQRPATLFVLKVNPALLLYQRLGFRPVEDREIRFKMRWDPAEPAPK